MSKRQQMTLKQVIKNLFETDNDISREENLSLIPFQTQQRTKGKQYRI